jgi:alpha-L-fucosidase
MKTPRLLPFFCAVLALAPFTLRADGDHDKFAAATAAARAANATTEPMAAGKFAPTWESLEQYETPEWFRDAKFGIWAHWGPQCQPEMGDWYARLMYQPTNPVHDFHAARYGPATKFGFKDVIRTWEAERWDPAKLMALYKRAGAKYFMALANHHDNLDLYDSKYQPWNSVNVGPHKDLIGGWATAARANGLRFAVSVHASHAWNWYEVAQRADPEGKYKDLPYDGKLTAADGQGKWWDGLDPQDLYAQNHPPADANWEWKPKTPGPAEGPDPRLPDAAYLNKFFNRTVDLINRYNPDAIYFDDTRLPFEPYSDVGLRIAAHYYNRSAALHGGKNEAVINGKKLTPDQRKAMVYDIERGKAGEILPQPWQTDTCIGDWHYKRSRYENDEYKKSGDVIRMLVDIVSKNGNLMLNIPLRGDGTADDKEIRLLEDIATWMAVNSEAIYATRPWKIYGEGPSTQTPGEKGQFDGHKDIAPFTAEDVRFTTSKDGKTLYAIAMGWPAGGNLVIKSLATGSPQFTGEIADFKLLGTPGRLLAQRTANGLLVTFPTDKPAAGQVAACVLKMTLR